MTKFRKGSPEAIAYMAHLRSLRGKGYSSKSRSTKKKMKGGFILPAAAATVLKFAAPALISLTTAGLKKLASHVYHKIKGSGNMMVANPRYSVSGGSDFSDDEATILGTLYSQVYNVATPKQQKEIEDYCIEHDIPLE